MAIDKTLVDHAGKLIEDVGWCWDHAHERYGIAQDAMSANDVCPSGAHYPMEWRRFKNKDACQKGEGTDHTERCMELITDALPRALPGDFTLDSYCTRAKVLNHMQSTHRAYVGDLQLNRKLVYDGREQSLQAVARQMPWQAKNPVRVGNRRYGYFRKQRRIPEVTHPVRRVLFWKERDDAEASKALVSNRLVWEGIRLVLVDRHRWTGTEPLPRDGQQAVGLGECQGRHGEGQTRHVYLVSAADSLLRRSLHQHRPQDWARPLLTTIGEACRAVKGALLGQLVDWIVDKLADDHGSVPQSKAVLAQT